MSGYTIRSDWEQGRAEDASDPQRQDWLDQQAEYAFGISGGDVTEGLARLRVEQSFRFTPSDDYTRPGQDPRLTLGEVDHPRVDPDVNVRWAS